jgi:hypothetical protein
MASQLLHRAQDDPKIEYDRSDRLGKQNRALDLAMSKNDQDRDLMLIGAF